MAKNYSKLTKKIITDKKGHRKTVWVRATQEPKGDETKSKKQYYEDFNKQLDSLKRSRGKQSKALNSIKHQYLKMVQQQKDNPNTKVNEPMMAAAKRILSDYNVEGLPKVAGRTKVNKQESQSDAKKKLLDSAEFHRKKMAEAQKNNDGAKFHFHMGKRDMYKEMASKEKVPAEQDKTVTSPAYEAAIKQIVGHKDFAGKGEKWARQQLDRILNNIDVAKPTKQIFTNILDAEFGI